MNSKKAKIFTLVGSGETAPTMVKVHRKVINLLNTTKVDDLILAMPYGFQENAAELSEK